MCSVYWNRNISHACIFETMGLWESKLLGVFVALKHSWGKSTSFEVKFYSWKTKFRTVFTGIPGDFLKNKYKLMLFVSKRKIVIIWKWYNILHEEELVQETYLPCSTRGRNGKKFSSFTLRDHNGFKTRMMSKLFIKVTIVGENILNQSLMIVKLETPCY
jgi:hypothetical protein